MIHKSNLNFNAARCVNTQKDFVLDIYCTYVQIVIRVDLTINPLQNKNKYARLSIIAEKSRVQWILPFFK